MGQTLFTHEQVSCHSDQRGSVCLSQVTPMWTRRVRRDFLQLRRGEGVRVVVADWFLWACKVWISGTRMGGKRERLMSPPLASSTAARAKGETSASSCWPSLQRTACCERFAGRSLGTSRLYTARLHAQFRSVASVCFCMTTWLYLLLKVTHWWHLQLLWLTFGVTICRQTPEFDLEISGLKWVQSVANFSCYCSPKHKFWFHLQADLCPSMLMAFATIVLSLKYGCRRERISDLSA